MPPPYYTEPNEDNINNEIHFYIVIKKVKKVYHCPYCWAKNKIKIEGDYKIIRYHPPDFQVEQYNLPLVFWDIKFPEDIREFSSRCNKCGRDIHVELWPYSIGDKRNSKNVNYYLKLGLGKTNKIDHEFFLESILTRFCKSLRVNYVIGSFFFMLTLALIWIIPLTITGGLSRVINDYGFLVIFIMSFLMLILLKRHSDILRKYLDCRNLPILLHENYLKSNWCTTLEEMSFKGNVLGHPYSLIKAPTFCGLVAVLFYILWRITIFINTNNFDAFLELTTTYYSFHISFISFLFGIPFWTMLLLIIGNVIWLFLATASLTGLIGRFMPLNINVIKELGGVEIFGKILLSSSYPMATIGVCLPIMLVVGLGFGTLVFLLGLFLIFLFMLMMGIGFFYPLIPIHKKIKKIKENEMEKISNRLDVAYSKIKEDYRKIPEKELLSNHLLISYYNRILNLSEWPFKINTLIKIFSAIIIPLLSFFLNFIFFSGF